MKSILLPLLLALSAMGQDWQMLNYYPGYSWSAAPSAGDDLSTFDFPDAAAHSHYPAFLVTTQAMRLNLSTTPLTLTFTLEASLDTVFRFGGQGAWNTGSLPANARLFFSCETGYDNNTPHPTNFWFYDPQWAEISTNTGTVTLTAPMDPSQWSDAGGPGSTPNDDLVGSFWNACSNVVQMGLAFGGGSFFDTGIAVAAGSATFHLRSFTIPPWLTISGTMLTVHGFSPSYEVQRSEDLQAWDHWTTTGPELPCVIMPGFYRARIL